MKLSMAIIKDKLRKLSLARIKEKTRWGKVMVVVALVVGFLSGYEVLRNKGSMFVCDAMGVVGLAKVFSFCEKIPGDADQLVLLEFLKANRDKLNSSKKRQLEELEALYIDKAFKVLAKANKLAKAPETEQAQATTKEELRTTITKGDTHERRAIAMIAEGDIQGGLDLLTEEAEAGALSQAKKWRRIGRLAYGVDTARALAAYEKVVGLDRTDPWDAIYLGRLYVLAGDLARARQVYEAELKRLPESEKRNRAVLFNEIGNVQRAQGDLAAALKSYQADMAITARLAKSDPSNAEWQRDLAVSQWRLAKYGKDSGVTWQEVADQYNKMEQQGILLPGDVEFAEEARRRAQ